VESRKLTHRIWQNWSSKTLIRDWRGRWPTGTACPGWSRYQLKSKQAGLKNQWAGLN